MPRRVDHFEILCLLAEKHRWRVLLHSDGRKPAGTVEPPASRLTLLELRESDEMLARITLRDGDRLTDCAEAVLARLASAGYIPSRTSG